MDVFAVQVSYYGIVRIPWVVTCVANAVVVFEVALGAQLLSFRQGEKKLAWATIGVLVVFSFLIAYAWIFGNLADCGCFGEYLKMTPAMSLGKNILLAALCLSALVQRPSLGTRGLAEIAYGQPPPFRKSATAKCFFRSMLLIIMITIAMLASVASSRKTGAQSSIAKSEYSSTANLLYSYTFEYNGRALSLAKGVYLLAMLSESCEGCAKIAKSLNAYASNTDLPPIVCFVMGDAQTLARFKQTHSTNFPTKALPPLEFLQYIGTAPPRFILLKDGVEVNYWDEKLPDELTVIEAVLVKG